LTLQQTDKAIIAQLIARIGETDQQYLTGSTPTLALQRAHLRLELVQFSHQKTEKVYFLTEAATLLELALMEIDDAGLHATLTTTLADIYLAFYQTTHEKHYLLIVNQLLKPLSHLDDANIFLGLARASAAKQHIALSKHWLGKLMKLGNINPSDIMGYPEFHQIQQDQWFIQLLKPTLN
jgi:hypothetical protein